MPKVSVLTPTFDHARYVGECVESVLGQTFEDWEMIVVDDGSTDGTPDIVEGYRDSRIRILRRPHSGIGALCDTYNAALREASGAYVAILEGDDTWPPGKLKNQVPELEGSDAVLVSGPTLMVDDEGRTVTRIPEVRPSTEGLTNSPLGSGPLALLHPSHLTFTFPVSTVLRRAALESTGGFRSRPYLPVVDLPTFVAVGEYGPFRWVDDVSGHWRRHKGSTTSGNLPAILDGAYRLAREWCEDRAPMFDLPSGSVDKLLDAWSAFMAHRFVLLSLELLGQGDHTGAEKAVRLASTFRGPLKRRLKTTAAQACVRLRLPERVAQRVTRTDAGARLNRYESLVDRGMLDRAPWLTTSRKPSPQE
ncbi:MAG: glycosyltransferase family 2 protein [Armatimonadetes bacterium]|nr:glycosyltransferase family 2 protein [Armatimonadota bacterium]